MENKLKIQRYLKQYGKCWYNLDLMQFTVDKFDLIRDFFIQYNNSLPYSNTRFDEVRARYELIKVLDNKTEKYFVLKSFLTRNVLTTSDYGDLEHVNFCFDLQDGDFIEITDNAQEKFELYSKELLEEKLKRKELIKVENNDSVKLEIGQVTVENNDNVTLEAENDTKNINSGKNNNEISW